MSEPVTFREQSYAIFDLDENAVRTTRWGNLAIFSVRGVAEQIALTSQGNVKVVPVWITRVEKES